MNRCTRSAGGSTRSSGRRSRASGSSGGANGRRCSGWRSSRRRSARRPTVACQQRRRRRRWAATAAAAAAAECTCRSSAADEARARQPQLGQPPLAPLLLARLPCCGDCGWRCVQLAKCALTSSGHLGTAAASETLARGPWAAAHSLRCSPSSVGSAACLVPTNAWMAEAHDSARVLLSAPAAPPDLDLRGGALRSMGLPSCFPLYF